MTNSFDVTWELDGITMEGTVVRPDGDGPFPAVVLVAGSGPTDRDWCSPLLPGTNGSGLPTTSKAFLEENTSGLRSAASTSALRVSAYHPSLNTTGPASRKVAQPTPRSEDIGKSSRLSSGITPHSVQIGW